MEPITSVLSTAPSGTWTNSGKLSGDSFLKNINSDHQKQSQIQELTGNSCLFGDPTICGIVSNIPTTQHVHTATLFSTRPMRAINLFQDQGGGVRVQSCYTHFLPISLPLFQENVIRHSSSPPLGTTQVTVRFATAERIFLPMQCFPQRTLFAKSLVR